MATQPEIQTLNGIWMPAIEESVCFTMVATEREGIHCRHLPAAFPVLAEKQCLISGEEKKLLNTSW